MRTIAGMYVKGGTRCRSYHFIEKYNGKRHLKWRIEVEGLPFPDCILHEMDLGLDPVQRILDDLNLSEEDLIHDPFIGCRMLGEARQLRENIR